MLIEKYIVIGIKEPADVVTNIIKIPSYNSIIDNINFIKEQKHDIFVDDFVKEFTYKKDALKRLETIRKNIVDVRYWSILPIIVDVPLQEARFLKLKQLKKKLK